MPLELQKEKPNVVFAYLGANIRRIIENDKFLKRNFHFLEKKPEKIS